MIHVERGPAPPGFKERADAEHRKIRGLTKDAHWRESQTRLEFDVSLWKRIKEPLISAFHHKCAYCESPVGVSAPATVENIRPKSIYPWLAFEWTNMLPACQACNMSKGSRFPLANESARAKDRRGLARERPLLLDPCVDRPERHLVFDADGHVYSETKRGKATIDTLALNRPPLVEARRIHATHVQAAIDDRLRNPTTESIESLTKLLSETVPYAAVARQLGYRASLQFLPNRGKGRATIRKASKTPRSISQDTSVMIPAPNLLPPQSGTAIALATPDILPLPHDAVAISSDAKKLKRARDDYRKHEQVMESFTLDTNSGRVSKRYFAKRRIIERVHIKNFKVIRNLELSLVSDVESPSSFLMLLGNNATGKSSVLRALALTLMGRDERNEFCDKQRITPNDVLTRGAKEGRVRIWMSGGAEPLELGFRRNARHFTGGESNKTYVFGYGATRLLPRFNTEPSELRGAVNVDNLFNPVASLIDADAKLHQLPKDRFGPAARVLKALLPVGRRAVFEKQRGRQGRRIRLRDGGEITPLAELSDGFQSVVAMAADVLSVLVRVWKTNVDHAEAIVLIDEIDAHLHPTWRKIIVPRLRACFPNVQFIATSHDPLCLRGLKKGEVVVLRRPTRSRIVAVKDLPSPEGMTPDQLLTSEHFGLESTLDEDTAALFERYYKLLSRRTLSRGEATELRNIKRRLDAMHHLGRTRREQIMLEAIDRYLATPPPGQAAAQEQGRRELEETLDAVYRDGRRPSKSAARGRR